MVDDEEAEYDAFIEEMLEHLSNAVEGYDLRLPMREAFGVPWDMRVQLAYLPAPRRSVSDWQEFFLVSLTREGQPRFIKRCDSPPEVLLVVHNLIAGELNDVPASPAARLDVPDGATKYPVWLWGAAGSDEGPSDKWPSLRSPR